MNAHLTKPDIDETQLRKEFLLTLNEYCRLHYYWQRDKCDRRQDEIEHKATLIGGVNVTKFCAGCEYNEMVVDELMKDLESLK